ncbi:phosphate-starvation-inducible PsiE family protein [Taibaiella soli]|uniref:Phosphate-starvation-inducible E-like protein n=1 Tax=Taibaiella soli TaxID=1649169 RepID=A0A2W2B783_9BACT|nr:phosphate-starvation-inducible PsiE family protein [Taibaiella soli]PZF72109.1 hypothetical protein DN068_14335 [Taibaiella soli]
MTIDKFYKKFEQLISNILLGLGMFFVLFQTLELFWETLLRLVTRIPKFDFDYNPEQGRELIILFFNVLLTLEIVETIRVFKQHHETKIRVILLVCLIAVSRKILMTDATHGTPEQDTGTAILLFSLSAGYFLVTRSLSKKDRELEEKLDAIEPEEKEKS